MSADTDIEWCAHPGFRPKTLNPTRGCSRISPGCGKGKTPSGCYAEWIAARFSGTDRNGKDQPFKGFAERGTGWTGRVEPVWGAIDELLSWTQPCCVFVNSMSDLFHENLVLDDIATIYGGLIAGVHLRGHRLLILTKRSARMRELLNDKWFWNTANGVAYGHVMERVDALDRRSDDARATLDDYGPDSPPPGIWNGVSVESRDYLWRLDDLRAAPTALRFVSFEPLLGDVTPVNLSGMAWTIWGTESGKDAREANVSWIRKGVRASLEQSVPPFVKQIGKTIIDRNDAGFTGEWPEAWPDSVDQDSRVEHDIHGTRDDHQGAGVRVRLRARAGRDPNEWPEDLRRRDFPRAA